MNSLCFSSRRHGKPKCLDGSTEPMYLRQRIVSFTLSNVSFLEMNLYSQFFAHLLQDMIWFKELTQTKEKEKRRKRERYLFFLSSGIFLKTLPSFKSKRMIFKPLASSFLLNHIPHLNLLSPSIRPLHLF